MPNRRVAQVGGLLLRSISAGAGARVPGELGKDLSADTNEHPGVPGSEVCKVKRQTWLSDPGCGADTRMNPAGVQWNPVAPIAGWPPDFADGSRRPKRAGLRVFVYCAEDVPKQ